MLEKSGQNATDQIYHGKALLGDKTIFGIMLAKAELKGKKVLAFSIIDGFLGKFSEILKMMQMDMKGILREERLLS